MERLRHHLRIHHQGPTHFAQVRLEVHRGRRGPPHEERALQIRSDPRPAVYQ